MRFRDQAFRVDTFGSDRLASRGFRATRVQTLGSDRLASRGFRATRVQTLGSERLASRGFQASRVDTLGSERLASRGFQAPRVDILGADVFCTAVWLALSDRNGPIRYLSKLWTDKQKIEFRPFGAVPGFFASHRPILAGRHQPNMFLIRFVVGSLKVLILTLRVGKYFFRPL